MELVNLGPYLEENAMAVSLGRAGGASPAKLLANGGHNGAAHPRKNGRSAANWPRSLRIHLLTDVRGLYLTSVVPVMVLTSDFRSILLPEKRKR